MATVSYKYGTKATYLGLLSRDPYALYWCTDTKELFKGDDLYTDGLRFVDSKANLPEFAVAAEGKIYFCTDNGSAFVLSPTRDSWVQVMYGVDGTTIEIDENGLLHVIGGASGDVSEVLEDLAALTQRVTDLETIVAGGTNFKGQVDNAEALPQEGNKPGDIYQTTDDNKQYIWDGDEWKEYGSSLTLTNDLINTEQFEIIEGKLNIKTVDGGDVTIPGENPEDPPITIADAIKGVQDDIAEANTAIQQNTQNITNITAAITWQEMTAGV